MSDKINDMAWHIGEILIQKKLISWEQLHDALEEQKQTKEMTGQVLIRKRYISENLFYKALAEQYQLRFVDLRRTRINPKGVSLIPQSIATKYAIMPIEVNLNSLVIGISNPRLWPEQELKEISQMVEIRPVICSPEAIQLAIDENYPKHPAVPEKS